MAHAFDLGWSAVALNLRGCSGEINRLPVTYHSGKSEDLESAVKWIRAQGYSHLYLAGFSIGGNMVLKWLGEKGDGALGLVHKAAVVSVPYDLEKSVTYMDRGFNRQVYTRNLLNGLKKKARQKWLQFPAQVPLRNIQKAQTFREFDDAMTAPLNGFKNAVDYWTHSSAVHYLRRIQTETLLIHAQDDPFFPGRELPLEVIRCNHRLYSCWSERGGHLGFVSGKRPWRQRHWLEAAMMSFFRG